MKQILVVFGIACVLASCRSEADLFTVDNSKIGVRYKRTRGTIFTSNYPFRNFYVSDVDSTTRWTPDKNDIELAEEILKHQVKAINKNRLNQISNCPVIHRHLNDYFRQYVGITNDQGEKIIHINFHWDKFTLLDRIKLYDDNRLDFNSDYAIVFDGCSYYWQINVNLDRKKLTDLAVNGIARK